MQPADNLSVVLLGIFAIVSSITFLLWGYDKFCAGSHRWRIPEKVLRILIIAGGAAGALTGMFLFRHKIRKSKFWVLGFSSLGMQILLLIWCFGVASTLL